MNAANIFLDLETYVDALEDTMRGPEHLAARYEARIKRDQEWAAFYRNQANGAKTKQERESCLISAQTRQALAETEMAKLAALREREAA